MHVSQKTVSNSTWPCKRAKLRPGLRPLWTQPTKAVLSAAPSESFLSAIERIRHVVGPYKLDNEDLVVHEVESVHHRLTDVGKLPQHVLREEQLASHALMLTNLMATGSVFRTLQILKRCPDLLQLDPSEMAAKVLQLKMLLPQSNVGELLYQKPGFLLMEDLEGTLRPALKKLRALMPGIPIEKKLHEGGTVWWSFSSLLGNSTSGEA